jgi:hypothetical protein
MFGSIILDVGVGLILIYLLLSLIASSIREAIAAQLRTRSKMLDKALRSLLGNGSGDALIRSLYEHPLISSLYAGDTYDAAKKAKTLPSYIPARNFALAIMDLAVRGTDPTSAASAGAESSPITIDAVRAQVGRLGSPTVQRAVLTALDTAKGDLATAQANLEAWFNGMMDRVSGWYKRDTQKVLFAIGLALATLLDADTVRIAKDLYREPGVRAVAVGIASSITSRDTASATAAKGAIAKLDSLSQPLGLTIQFLGAWPSKIEAQAIWDRAVRGWFGWLLTALAISLGAPFWFDALNKIVTLRSTMKPGASGSNERSDGGTTAPTAPSDTPRSTNGAVPQPPPVLTLPPQNVPARAMSIAPPGFQPHTWASGHPDAGIL